MNWLGVILIAGIVLMCLPRLKQSKRPAASKPDRHTKPSDPAGRPEEIRLRELRLREEQLALDRERFEWQVEQAEAAADLAEEMSDESEDLLY